MFTANRLNKDNDGRAEASTDENLHDTDMHLDEKLLHQIIVFGFPTDQHGRSSILVTYVLASPDDASEVDTLPTHGGLCTSAAATTPPRTSADQVVDGLTKVLSIPN